MTDKNDVRITFLATAGVIMEYKGTRYMVDGLFGTGHPFSVVPQPLQDRLLDGSAGFGPADYLFFTHLHPDHFAAAQTITYLQNNKVRGVFLPVDESDPTMRQDGLRVQNWMIEHRVPFSPLNMPIGRFARYDMGSGALVTVFNTGHMGPKYAEVSNYCLLLHLDGKTLLFTGDADFHTDCFTKGLEGHSVDFVFINPLFYESPRGRAILENIVRPKKAVLYHIPFREDDSFMIRNMVKRQLERYHIEGCSVFALTEPDQSLVL